LPLMLSPMRFLLNCPSTVCRPLDARPAIAGVRALAAH
jgi:hypothetical protein